MTDNDGIRDWPEDDREDFGEGRPPRHYDPLFPAWDDAPDDAFDIAPIALSDDYTWDPGGSPSWEAPIPDREPWPAASGAGKPTSWYATGWQEAHAPAVTEAQRRLREAVITIPHPARRWTVTARELAETLLLAALIFLSVRASFQNFRVEGASMYPSLENGEYLIVNKLSYATLDLGVFDFLPFYNAGADPVKHLWGEPERGDIIVFRAPTSPNRDFIKRIIGLPGDTVEITPDESVIVNGTVLSEPYIQGTTRCSGAGNECTFEIPEAGSPEAMAECGSEACYFVMGDNRENSSDSRQKWLVPEENIIGKALITYWHEGGPEFDAAPNHSVSADEPDR